MDVGSEVPVFDSREELLSLVRRAFEDDGWRDQHIEAGRHRVLAEHTYRHRAQRMLRDVLEVAGRPFP